MEGLVLEKLHCLFLVSIICHDFFRFDKTLSQGEEGIWIPSNKYDMLLGNLFQNIRSVCFYFVTEGGRQEL